MNKSIALGPVSTFVASPTTEKTFKLRLLSTMKNGKDASWAMRKEIEQTIKTQALI